MLGRNDTSPPIRPQTIQPRGLIQIPRRWLRVKRKVSMISPKSSSALEQSPIRIAASLKGLQKTPARTRFLYCPQTPILLILLSKPLFFLEAFPCS